MVTKKIATYDKNLSKVTTLKISEELSKGTCTEEKIQKIIERALFIKGKDLVELFLKAINDDIRTNELDTEPDESESSICRERYILGLIRAKLVINNVHSG